MTIQKLRPSFTFTQDRLAELQAVIPEAFADGEINWEVLKEALGDYLEDESSDTEHFGLSWPGKREARRLAAMPSKGTLKPAHGEGINEDATGNIFIEGDNLEVLKLLQKSYADRIKLIYIDPPYNTGKDLVYKDDFRDPLEEYLKKTGQADEEGHPLTTNTKADGRFHSNWLNMIYPRLLLAHRLLKKDGVIFASIDDHEVHHLRMLMNEIFGEENFIACVANVNNPKGRSDDNFIATAHEYLVIYKKADAIFNGWKPEENVIRRYNKLDQNGMRYREIDLRKTGDGDRREDRPNLFYYFLYNPDTKELHATHEESTPKGLVQIVPLRDDGSFGRWRWEINTAMSHLNRLIPKLMPIRKTWSVFEMDYLTSEERVKPTSAWTQKEVNSERGSEQFIELGFDKNIFPRPKPVGLLKQILELVTKTLENDIVLDFFAGSCTTAQATLELNQEDGGNRRFICIQLPESTLDNPEIRKAGYSTIADIGKERIRRVITKMQRIAQSKLIDIERENPEDLGFKAFKLGRTNYKGWQDYQGENVQEIETFFNRFETPLVEGWTPEGLLTEILLLQGFPLNSTVIRQDDFRNNNIVQVHSEACSHHLFVCLDNNIVDDTIEQLHLHTEDVFICLDSALSDQGKMRLTDICNLSII